MFFNLPKRRSLRKSAQKEEASQASDAAHHISGATAGSCEIGEWLQEGYALHQSGNLSAADQLYRKILEREPEHVDALYLRGRLCGQCGELTEATQCLARAIELMPYLVDAHVDLGNVYRLQGALEMAAEEYRRATTIAPGNALAYFNCGIMLKEMGNADGALEYLQEAKRLEPELAEASVIIAYLYLEQLKYEKAIEQFQEVLRRTPERAEAQYGMGIGFYNLQNLEEAICAFKAAVDLRVDYSEAYFNLGLALHRQGEFDEGIAYLEKAVETGYEPAADAYYHLGLCCMEQQCFEEATDAFRLATHLKPDFAAAYLELGRALRGQDRLDDALEAFESATKLNQEDAAGFFEIGTIQYRLGDFGSAVGHFGMAIEIRPDHQEALSNIGLVYRDLGKYREAEVALRQALVINDGFVIARCNLGIVLADQGRYEEAIACYEEVLRQCPEHDEALWNMANKRLLLGDFAGGWKDYEKRWLRRSAIQRPFKYRRWGGESLEGQTLLVYGEQGLGDEIMFASCLPEVTALGGRCVIECDPRLAELFGRSFPVATVHGRKDMEDSSWLSGVEPIDVQIPMGSLPMYFRKSLSDFPQHEGYLRADPGRVAYWRDRLAGLGRGLKVGISWCGGTKKSRTLLRSIGLESWLPILGMEDADFVSLQYTPCDEELAQFRERHGIVVHHWQEAIDDYDETAALVGALDLVVSVCTSVVSLAGALGRPVWVLVPSSPGWIFMSEGERTPWFPSARLFRQAEPNDWSPVIRRIAGELKAIGRA